MSVCPLSSLCVYLICLCVHLDDSDVDSTDYSSEEDRPVQVSQRHHHIVLSLSLFYRVKHYPKCKMTCN